MSTIASRVGRWILGFWIALGAIGVLVVVAQVSPTLPFPFPTGTLPPGAIAFGRVMLTGNSGRAVPVPAFLYGAHMTTATTTQVKAAPGVIGCVVINTAGASGSTIKLYNSPVLATLTGSVLTGALMATIDGTQVGEQFCYAMIFSGGLGVITAGSPAPDVTVTYR
jgi:hypothetical protein